MSIENKNGRSDIMTERKKVLADINTMKGAEVTELEFKLYRIDIDGDNSQSIIRMLRLEGMDILDVCFEHNYLIIDSC